MNYLNGASNYLKEGFTVPDFAAYTKQSLAKMAQEIKAPCYAVEGEQECLDRLHGYIQKNPYRWFENRAALVAEQMEMRKATSLTRLSDALLYECQMDACSALKISHSSAFTFVNDEKHLRFNTRAVEHMGMMWIFISRNFRINGILSDLELCYLIGRALGHAITYHADIEETQFLTSEQSRAQALTADRAGLMAALWRAERMYPSLMADELVRKALDTAARVMHKLDILDELKKNESATPELLQQLMEKSPVTEKRARKGDRLPTTWERIEALHQFAVSIPFVRCVASLWGEGHMIVRSYSGSGLLQKNIHDSVLD